MPQPTYIRKKTLFIRCLLFSVIAVLGNNQVRAGNEELVQVIANPQTEQQLSLLAIRAIFLQRKRSWDNGEPITLVVLPDDHPVHKRFCRQVLTMYPYVLREHWDRIVFSGNGTNPTTASDLQQMRKIVESTPGAIGYLPNSADIDNKLIQLPAPDDNRSSAYEANP